MGQKVNPYGFRLGITTDHVSRWFSDSTKPGQRYADYVAEDIKIRRLLKTQLDRAGVSNIDNPATPVRWRDPDSYKRHAGFDIAAIFHRVIKQIRHCLGYKLPVGAHQRRLRRLQNERATGLFRNGAI